MACYRYVLVVATLAFNTFYPQSVGCLPTIYEDGQSRNIKAGQTFYPVTASWFRDRFTMDAWIDTLRRFQTIGGDTVALRAPDVVIRAAVDIRNNPSFQWCRSKPSPNGPDCITEAKNDLKQKGLNVKAMATFQYEENFSEKIMCSDLDRRINNSRVYYRLVLPLNNVSLGSCEFKRGDDVMVLFTSYAGVDPHNLLIQSAQKVGNISVYFSLPGAPKSGSGELQITSMPAYYQFVHRVLADHSFRYTSSLPKVSDSQTKLKFDPKDMRKGSFEDKADRFQEIDINDLNIRAPKIRVAPPPSPNTTLTGYYVTEEACLAELTNKTTPLMGLYKNLGAITKSFKKKFMVSPYIVLNKSKKNYTLQNHVDGFTMLAASGAIDVIAVQEGRGYGSGCYYFDTQIDMAISKVDPGLDSIVRYLNPKVPEGVTFRQHFTGSNNELFRLFGDARDQLHKTDVRFEFWLNVEAFEYLRDDPCLPVDSRGSGMAELLDRTTKSRIDWALSTAGLYPNKVISFAWDSDYTCTTPKHNQSLVDEIFQDAGRPIIMHCGWHSKDNMSVVLIGHGILSVLTQGYNVEYQLREGTTQKAFAYPYYVEGDWGPANNRIPSLVYTQLYNVPDPFDISLNGTVTISAANVYHPCVFTYDYR